MPTVDKVVRAFRNYARLCPDDESLSGLEVTDRLRGCCRSENRVIELLAVRDTLRFLEAGGKSETVTAVRQVYFAGRGRTPRKSEISGRVLSFAFENNLDERTVWRRLDEAKQLYLKLSEHT